MVSDTPGTTRDLKYAAIKWQDRNFKLIDTGGFLSQSKAFARHDKERAKKVSKRKGG